MNFDIRAGVARLSSRPMAPNEDSNAFEQAVLQFNTLLVAAKVAYPDNLDILALKPFEHPSIVKSIVFSDSVFRLTDALEYLPEANSTGTQLISDKFGILLSDKQLKKDFEAYQDAVNGMGLLFFDIDKFKLLNTKYTETIVDRDLLIIYQRMILDLVRHRGFAYSVGGDEFIILLLNVSQEETISFANRLIEATRKTEFCVANDTIQITISVGVACYPTDSDTYQTLRELANSAENKAKANGRDQVFFFRSKNN